MINSNMIFNEIILDTNKVITLMNYWRLKNIFFIKGSLIKKLSWDSCKMTHIEVVTLLNFVPNLNYLECSVWKLENKFDGEPAERLNLLDLKKLKIIRCNEPTEEFFLNFLTEDVLKILTTDFDPCQLLVKQTKVTELDLNVEEFSHEKINFPKLTKLSMMMRKYKRDQHFILHSILPQQSANLIYLDLIKCIGIFDGDDFSFITVCGMNHLQCLKINVDGLNNDVFKNNFNELKNLRELEIESVEHDYSNLVDIIEEFSKMIFFNLNILKFEIESLGLPLDRIEKMGKNLRNLKQFSLKCVTPLPLVSFLINFKSLEQINIDYHYSREFSTICNGHDDKKFAQLKIVHLEGFSFGSEMNSNETHLKSVIKMLPNLEILDIDINLPLNSALLLNILSNLPKMRAIKNLYMVQSGEFYEKFDSELISKLIQISTKLQHFSMEFKLKGVNMDVSKLKEMLSKEFILGIRRNGPFVNLTLSK